VNEDRCDGAHIGRPAQSIIIRAPFYPSRLSRNRLARPRERGVDAARQQVARMTPETIHSLIAAGLPGAEITVQGDDGVHFEARVVYAGFAGKLPIARHRMVYATLGDKMGGEIHALALKTLTPDEASAR
jgi:acid stress-induced BolA-like protein IbaG/YrbA